MVQRAISVAVVAVLVLKAGVNEKIKECLPTRRTTATDRLLIAIAYCQSLPVVVTRLSRAMPRSHHQESDSLEQGLEQFRKQAKINVIHQSY